MNQQAWWNKAVIYEIFPKSFSDKGFKGIEERLPYIQSLGIDAIWLCPIFMSPFLDSGYDISDYYQVNPMFGSMEDFKDLIRAAHNLGIRIILDIALNHTSHEHPWFIDASSNKDSVYKDYYIFEEGLDINRPPNDWVSSKTRKSTWTYNDRTDDFYLHIYTKYQPDLNWKNPLVRKACYDVLIYWLDLGVDGFRLDVINKIAKPDINEMIASQGNKLTYADQLYENHPMSHIYIHEMNQYVKARYPSCFLLGQISGVTVEEARAYADGSRKELDSFLQFEHMDLNRLMERHLRRWNLSEFKAIMMKWQQVGADLTGTTFLANHDSARAVNHFTDASGNDTQKAAKMLCMCHLCLHGIPIIYMGDELGMTNIDYENIEDFKDIRSHDIYENLLAKGVPQKEIITMLNQISRDNARQALDINTDEPRQVFEFFQWMIGYRKASDILMFGVTKTLDLDDDVFAYQRIYEDKQISVVCNFTGDIVHLDLRDLGKLIKSTEGSVNKECLMPFEARIYLKETGIRSL